MNLLKPEPRHCTICQKKLRSDNLDVYCRAHRNHSPRIKEMHRQYAIKTFEKRRQKWANMSLEERNRYRDINKKSSEKWRKNNKELRLKVRKKWDRDNRGKKNASLQTSRAAPPPHPDYKVYKSPQIVRKIAIEKFGYICQKCGVETKEVDVDHIFPLWLVDRTDWPKCLHYWTDKNLTVLCRPCHIAKSAMESYERAKIKRILEKNARYSKS